MPTAEPAQRQASTDQAPQAVCAAVPPSARDQLPRLLLGAGFQNQVDALKARPVQLQPKGQGRSRSMNLSRRHADSSHSHTTIRPPDRVNATRAGTWLATMLSSNPSSSSPKQLSEFRPSSLAPSSRGGPVWSRRAGASEVMVSQSRLAEYAGSSRVVHGQSCLDKSGAVTPSMVALRQSRRVPMRQVPLGPAEVRQSRLV